MAANSSPPAPPPQLTDDSLVTLARKHAAALYGPPDVIFTHGEGAFVYDTQNRRYLDFAGGMGVNFLGHSHPRVVGAIAEQAGRLLHTSNAFLSPNPIKLAARLAQLCHGMQSFFVNSGAEAMEGAIKLARRYHHSRQQPRHRLVACTKSFHGRTMGALSVTGQPKMHTGFGPLLEGVDFVPFNDLAAAEAAVDGRTCAFVVEPIQGNGGVQVPSPHYLQGLRALTQRHGALLIHDEVQTGLGRCGTWLAADHDHVVPDIVCLAKALGGGLPLGAVLAPPAIMACFAQGAHGSTFGGNPVACAAALATLDAIEEEGLLHHSVALGYSLRQHLANLPHVREIRGRGLLLGVAVPELDVPALRRRCLREGLLTSQAGPDTLRLFVPAIASEDDCNNAKNMLQRALEGAANKGAVHGAL